MEGDFFGTLTPAEIEKKARKWRQGQKRRFNEKRRAGGGGGIDMGKAVSSWKAAEDDCKQASASASRRVAR
jgi:hypothetical protein